MVLEQDTIKILYFIGEYNNAKRHGLGFDYLFDEFKGQIFYDYGKELMKITKYEDKATYNLPTRKEIVNLYLRGEKLCTKVNMEEINKIINEYNSNANNNYTIDKVLENLEIIDYGDYVKIYNLDGELSYIGTMKDGKIDGFGATFIDNKLTYIGEFKDNARQGLGEEFENSKNRVYFKKEVYIDSEREKVECLTTDRKENRMILPVDFNLNEDNYINATLNEDKLIQIIKQYDTKWKNTFKSYYEDYLKEKLEEEEKNKNRPKQA